VAKKQSVFDQKVISNFCKENRVIVVDGGSRGELFNPFDRVSNEHMVVLRFEPDPHATIVKSSTEVIFNKGLWNEEATIQLHLANNPATSSVYPPNKELLECFVDRIGYPPRATEKVIEIEGVDIDSAVKNAGLPLVDFIKLDIHGAEYEAVNGALESLGSSCIGLLIESWCIGVHNGQKLMCDVERVLTRYGFCKFDTTQVMSWSRKQPKNLKSKNQIVGEENLYLLICNSKEEIIELGKKRAIMLASTAELFGHRGYALQLFSMMRDVDFITAGEYEEIRGYIISKNRITIIDKILMVVIHKLKRIQVKRI